MNERIRELAEQAAHDTRAIHNNAYWRLLDDLVEDVTWREKFAELVVKECMEVARPFYMGTPADSVYYVEQAINRISEHFGVEE